MPTEATTQAQTQFKNLDPCWHSCWLLQLWYIPGNKCSYDFGPVEDSHEPSLKSADAALTDTLRLNVIFLSFILSFLVLLLKVMLNKV